MRAVNAPGSSCSANIRLMGTSTELSLTIPMSSALHALENITHGRKLECQPSDSIPVSSYQFPIPLALLPLHSRYHFPTTCERFFWSSTQMNSSNSVSSKMTCFTLTVQGVV
jgi:hypothetical protein